jgi:hypothetical protein
MKMCSSAQPKPNTSAAYTMAENQGAPALNVPRRQTRYQTLTATNAATSSWRGRSKGAKGTLSSFMGWVGLRLVIGRNATRFTGPPAQALGGADLSAGVVAEA